MRRFGSLVVFIGLVALAAGIGSQFMPGEWYRSLNKPSWNPPNWLFGPVWTTLYVMIAIAGWLVWRSDGPRRQAMLSFWGGQLVLNAMWSWLFFGLKRPDLAMIDIVWLWLVIGTFTIGTWRLKRSASLLFIPYWIWVTFASVLNFAIWRLNARLIMAGIIS